MAATQCIKAQRRGEDNLLREKKGDLSALNVVNMVVWARRAGLNTSQTADPLGFWQTTENSHQKRENIQRVIVEKEKSSLVAGVKGHTSQTGWRR